MNKYLFKTSKEVEEFVYSSYVKYLPKIDHDKVDRTYRNPENTRYVLDLMGNPDRGSYNILVTGSKGKGSVSRLIAEILQSQGYKVGLFTSPHLIHYNERIRVNGKAITDEELVEYGNQIKESVDKVQSEIEGQGYIGPVGLTSVIAALYFKDKGTDFNIYECGKGAKYDDVAEIYSKGSVINTVFEEHIPELGNNLEEIAFNKAGVIKESQGFVVIGEQSEVVYNIIKEEAIKNKVKLVGFEKDYNYRVENKGTVCDIQIDETVYKNLKIGMFGEHQVKNTSVALKVAKEIGINIDEQKLRKSLEVLQLPGRLEKINENPLIYLDGCINRESAKYVKEIIDMVDKNKVIYVVGIPDSKDFKGVVEVINNSKDDIIVTKTNTEHLDFKLKQEEILKEIVNKEVYKSENISEAMELIDKIYEKDDIICILGTQSLVKDTKLYFRQDTLG